MVYEFSIPFLLSAILVSIHFFGCDVAIGPGETEEFRKTFKVETGTKIELHNNNGNINISKWDNDHVEVYAAKKTRKGKSELEKVKIEISTNGDMIIKTRYIKKNAKVSVSYEIKIPAGVIVGHIDNSNGKIELEGTSGDAMVGTSNGEINIRNVDGYVSTETSNGKIDIVGTTGVLKARTSNGSINAEIPSIRDNVNITTSNGNIKLYISPKLNANIEMRTSNGKVSIHDIQMVVSERSSTHMKGSIGNGGSELYVETSNGNIDIHRL